MNIKTVSDVRNFYEMFFSDESFKIRPETFIKKRNLVNSLFLNV